MPTTVERLKQKEREADAELARLQSVGNEPETPAVPTEEPSEPVVVDDPAAPTDQPADEAAKDELIEVSKKEFDALKAEIQREKAARSTITGKYNAEIPRLNQRLNELSAQLEGLAKAPTEPAKPPVPAHLRHVSKEEADGLDRDALDLQGRLARGEAEEATGRLRDEVMPVLNQMKLQLAKAKEESVWNIVEQTHPGARSIDAGGDPGWEVFLNTVDPLSGDTYKKIGQRAMERYDAAAVSLLFDRFKGSVDGSHTTEVKVDSRVASQVKPSATRVAQGPREPEKKTYRQSEYEDFIRRVTKGEFKGRAEELKRLENQYDSAAQDNRLILGE